MSPSNNSHDRHPDQAAHRAQFDAEVRAAGLASRPTTASRSSPCGPTSCRSATACAPPPRPRRGALVHREAGPARGRRHPLQRYERRCRMSDGLPGIPASNELCDLDLQGRLGGDPGDGRSPPSRRPRRTCAASSSTTACSRRTSPSRPSWRCAQARRADAELARGESRGPLHGVPIALKDLIAVKGVRMTAGSQVLADHVADRGLADHHEARRGRRRDPRQALACTSSRSGAPRPMAHGRRPVPDRPQPLERRADHGRLVVRLGGGSGGRPLRRRARLGHRRLDSRAGRAVRPRRAQADLWPGHPARLPAACAGRSITSAR